MEEVELSIENLVELTERMKKQMAAVECLLDGGILKVPKDIELGTLQDRIGSAFVKSMKITRKPTLRD